MTLLEIDLGNTRIKWRIRQEDDVLSSGFEKSASIKEGRLDSAFSVLLNQPSAALIEAINISSVVSACHQALDEWFRQVFSIQPSFAYVERQKAGVINGYTEVSQMGVDRWLGILAANQHYSAASIVVDAGSAITVDLIEVGGVHKGGYIVPGLVTMVNSLFSKTDQVKVQVDDFPNSLLLGETTKAAVLSGVGHMVVGLIKQTLGNMNNRTSLTKVFLTGGDAATIHLWLKAADINQVELELVPDLVLDGLKLASCKPLEGMQG